MPKDIKKVLILGSSGQIGSHLVKFCVDKGISVVEYDISRSPDEDLRQFSPKLSQLVKDVDFIFFLAFDVGGSRYLEKYQNTFDFVDNNMKIMTNTFNVLRDSRQPFIFASSQMSNMTNSPYGVLKLLGEHTTRILGGLTVHFWNVYGYEKDNDKSHVITDFVRMANLAGEIRMRTNGAEERDFLYADDACSALMTLATNFERIDFEEKLHITSFTWSSILEVAQIVSEKTGARVIPSSSLDIVQNSQKNMADKFILNYWSPSVNLRDGIDKIIGFILEENHVRG